MTLDHQLYRKLLNQGYSTKEAFEAASDVEVSQQIENLKKQAKKKFGK
jgi:hypothetical protein